MPLNAETLRGLPLDFTNADCPNENSKQRKVGKWKRFQAGEPVVNEKAFVHWLNEQLEKGAIGIGEPGLFRKAANFGRAIVRHNKDNRRKVPKHVKEERLARCHSCVLYNKKKDSCNHPDCGCVMKTKTGWASESCPIKRWTQYNPTSPKEETPNMTTTPIADTFDAAYCVNLERRPDRWARFKAGVPHDWPFCEIERVPAIDGKLVTPPQHWNQGGGAWGCFRSHQFLIEQALNAGLNSILLMEDDATFCEDFTERVTKFLKAVPDDWGMLYLGGQHLFVKQNPPKPVDGRPGVFVPYNVNRTHAFALRGPTMLKVYHHLQRLDWHKGHHIDHHFGRLHQRREDPIYCPGEWLVGQAEGKSNISGRKTPERFWAHAGDLHTVQPQDLPFVAVLGLHSSGSSCLAGVLYHLGVDLGDSLGGFYGNDPKSKKCGFEAAGLVQICERAVKFPETNYRQKKEGMWRSLRGWINTRKRKAAKTGKIAAGKYPTLCRFQNQLINVTGPTLRIITSERPIDDSVASMAKRFPKLPRNQIAAHQQWLQDGKEELVNRLDPNNVFRVPYYELLQDPEHWAGEIAAFLELEPTPEQLAAVVAWVQPEKRHV